MQPASPFWAEIGQRIAVVLFVCFVMSWIYSKPRSRRYLAIAFGAIIGIITLLDKLTWVASEAALKLASGIIPAAYCIVFLLLPAIFPMLNKPPPLLTRVTFK